MVEKHNWTTIIPMNTNERLPFLSQVRMGAHN